MQYKSLKQCDIYLKKITKSSKMENSGSFKPNVLEKFHEKFQNRFYKIQNKDFLLKIMKHLVTDNTGFLKLVTRGSPLINGYS